MPSCSTNSSNLSGNLNIQSITSSGARLLMTVPLSGFSGGRIGTCPDKCDGITAGNAIRYDNIVGSVSYGKYVKAQADTPANSEVVGIIEDVSVAGDPLVGDTGIATIVISGQINLAGGSLWESYEYPGSTGSAGGNDIYFLSAVTGGILQNLAPTEPTQVIKPVYQVAPDAPWTGQVVNYIGYQAGGQIVAEDDGRVPLGSIMSVPTFTNFGDERGPWVPFGTPKNLDARLGPTFGAAYLAGLNRISKTTIAVYTVSAPTSSWRGQTVSMRDAGVGRVLTGTITDLDAAGKEVRIEFQPDQYNNLEKYLVSGNSFATRSNARFQLSNKSAKYVSFKLPEENSKETITLDINNKPQSYKMNKYVRCPADTQQGDWTSAGGPTVTVPEQVTMQKLTVTDTITISNDTYLITNLVENIKELNKQMVVITKRTGGAADNSGATEFGSDI